MVGVFDAGHSFAARPLLRHREGRVSSNGLEVVLVVKVTGDGDGDGDGDGGGNGVSF